MNKTRTKSGRIQQKRADTLVRTIEERYGVDLGMRSDAQLHTVLREYGVVSLSNLLKKVHGRS